MIIDASKNKILPFRVEVPEHLGKRPDESDKSDESNEFYFPKEVTPTGEVSSF